jgi:hypothetical protein
MSSPKTNFTDEELVAGYLASIADGGGDSPHFWASGEVTELVGTDPERAWRLMVQMVRKSDNDTALACVAAGPLEDLLAWSGPLFIERTETLAGSEPKFREALTIIYTSRMTPEIRKRVEQAIGGNTR